jgi:hypothetical protein
LQIVEIYLKKREFWLDSAKIKSIDPNMLLWLPKSRNWMTILIQRSNNRNMFPLWRGFWHLNKTAADPKEQTSLKGGTEAKASDPTPTSSGSKEGTSSPNGATGEGVKRIGARSRILAGAPVFFSGRIRTSIGRCSYYESLEYEWSSYFLIWAATKKSIEVRTGIGFVFRWWNLHQSMNMFLL